MGNSSEGAEVERKRRYEVAKATYEFAEDEVAKAASTPILAGSELGRRRAIPRRPPRAGGRRCWSDAAAAPCSDVV